MSEVSEFLYIRDLKVVPKAFSALLSSYSGVPPEEQKSHILSIRDAAYAHYPYPCLGRFRFLELDLSTHPLYLDVILPALRKPLPADSDDAPDYLFLDLGTCLSQDIRQLLHSSAVPARLYGADLQPAFIDIGYKLFRDEASFPRSHFVTPANVFDFSPTSPLAVTCDAKIGILHVCAVFHLFNLQEQKAVARRCLKLLKKDVDIGKGKGKALICGAQVGNVNPGEFARKKGGTRFRHDGDTWRAMWEEVIKEEEWKQVVKGVDVNCILEEKNWRESIRGGDAEDENTTQKMIGRIEDGFRWMKWWTWVEFE